MVANVKQILRERRVVTVALTALAVIAALGAVLGLRGSAPHQRSERSETAPPATIRVSARPVPTITETAPRRATSSATPEPVHALRPLPSTDDPVIYAREVALALFEVDPSVATRAAFLQFWQGELPTVVYVDAAANGLTLGEQNSDAIDNLTRWWIPPQQVWDSEAADHTLSRFTITSVTVPDYWANAVANGTFRDPGLHMERVMGVLTQTYDTTPASAGSPAGTAARSAARASTNRAVVIDLGLLCGPTQSGGCRVVAPQKPPALGSS